MGLKMGNGIIEVDLYFFIMYGDFFFFYFAVSLGISYKKFYYRKEYCNSEKEKRIHSLIKKKKKTYTLYVSLPIRQYFMAYLEIIILWSRKRPFSHLNNY